MRLAMLCLLTNRPDTASINLILSPIKTFIRSAILLFLLLPSRLCCSCFHLLLRPSHGRIRRLPISYLKTWFYPLSNALRKPQTSAAHLFYHDKKGLRSRWKRFALVRKRASSHDNKGLLSWWKTAPVKYSAFWWPESAQKNNDSEEKEKL